MVPYIKGGMLAKSIENRILRRIFEPKWGVENASK